MREDELSDMFRGNRVSLARSILAEGVGVGVIDKGGRKGPLSARL